MTKNRLALHGISDRSFVVCAGASNYACAVDVLSSANFGSESRRAQCRRGRHGPGKLHSQRLVMTDQHGSTRERELYRQCWLSVINSICPVPSMVQLLSVFSRKVHGAAGPLTCHRPLRRW